MKSILKIPFLQTGVTSLCPAGIWPLKINCKQLELLFSFFLFLSLSLPGFGQSFELRYDHRALPVSNLGVSANFYKDMLGLEEIPNRTGKDTRRWFLLGNDQELHLILAEAKVPQQSKDNHFALFTDHLDQVATHLKQNDIPYFSWQGEPQTIGTRPDGIRQLYLQDPDGYWIEINGK